MRIAIVWKWGSGKTTISALLTSYLAKQGKSPLLIDADLNIHQPALFLPSGHFPKSKWLSDPQNTTAIKTYLKGNNSRITSLMSFRKTTPPARGSQLFLAKDWNHIFYRDFSEQGNWVNLMVVGTYTPEGIWASCYHNNLATLENILTHTDDRESFIIVDMVAGTDAFAGSLHAQFDLVIIAVEPTKKGVEVWNQYAALSQQAGVYHELVAIGNKCLDQDDISFLQENIPADKLIGTLTVSAYLRELERQETLIDFDRLEDENKALFDKILQVAFQFAKSPQERLNILYNLHKKYVAQDFIVQRFWDLNEQIDSDFIFPS